VSIVRRGLLSTTVIRPISLSKEFKAIGQLVQSVTDHGALVCRRHQHASSSASRRRRKSSCILLNASANWTWAVLQSVIIRNSSAVSQWTESLVEPEQVGCVESTGSEFVIREDGKRVRCIGFQDSQFEKHFTVVSVEDTVDKQTHQRTVSK